MALAAALAVALAVVLAAHGGDGARGWVRGRGRGSWMWPPQTRPRDRRHVVSVDEVARSGPRGDAVADVAAAARGSGCRRSGGHGTAAGGGSSPPRVGPRGRP